MPNISVQLIGGTQYIHAHTHSCQPQMFSPHIISNKYQVKSTCWQSLSYFQLQFPLATGPQIKLFSVDWVRTHQKLSLEALFSPWRKPVNFPRLFVVSRACTNPVYMNEYFHYFKCCVSMIFHSLKFSTQIFVRKKKKTPQNLMVSSATWSTTNWKNTTMSTLKILKNMQLSLKQ